MSDLDALAIEAMTRDQLVAALAASQLDVSSLRSELDDTNAGVLALYSELDSQADELRKATELKSRFLAYMSHEFRTPIGAILSNVRLLLDRVDGPLTSEQERQVKFIRETAMEFTEIVNDLLDLAKVEAGRIDISPDWFEMMDLFSALRGTFKPMLTNPEVLLIFDEVPLPTETLLANEVKGSAPLRSEADIVKSRQTVRSLTQQLKFSLVDQTKLITAASELSRNTLVYGGGGEMEWEILDTGSRVGLKLKFRDQGPGIADVELALKDGWTSGKGMGLGLSGSKRLVHEFEIESEVGKGTCVSVTRWK